jgi:hypothetical protein
LAGTTNGVEPETLGVVSLLPQEVGRLAFRTMLSNGSGSGFCPLAAAACTFDCVQPSQVPTA